MKISISGLASVRSSASDAEVTDGAVLARLNGRGFDEDTCARYVSAPLDRIGLVDGAWSGSGTTPRPACCSW